MTPAEKALELVAKYSRVLPTNQTTLLDHKNCALIAVDGIINMFNDVHKKLVTLDMVKGVVEDTATYEYWQEVKQEIEKL